VLFSHTHIHKTEVEIYIEATMNERGIVS